METPKPQKGLLFLKIGINTVLVIACLLGIMFGTLFLTLPNIGNTLAVVMLGLGLLLIWFSIKLSREHKELIVARVLAKPNDILLQWENHAADKIIITKDSLFRKQKYWKYTNFRDVEMSLIALEIIDKDHKKALSFEFKHAWTITMLVDIPQEQEESAAKAVHFLREEYKLAN